MSVPSFLKPHKASSTTLTKQEQKSLAFHMPFARTAQQKKELFSNLSRNKPTLSPLPQVYRISLCSDGFSFINVVWGFDRIVNSYVVTSFIVNTLEPWTDKVLLLKEAERFNKHHKRLRSIEKLRNVSIPL